VTTARPLACAVDASRASSSWLAGLLGGHMLTKHAGAFAVEAAAAAMRPFPSPGSQCRCVGVLVARA
jgi:hypothetical protein